MSELSRAKNQLLFTCENFNPLCNDMGGQVMPENFRAVKSATAKVPSAVVVGPSFGSSTQAASEIQLSGELELTKEWTW